MGRKGKHDDPRESLLQGNHDRANQSSDYSSLKKAFEQADRQRQRRINEAQGVANEQYERWVQTYYANQIGAGVASISGSNYRLSQFAQLYSDPYSYNEQRRTPPKVGARFKFPDGKLGTYTGWDRGDETYEFDMDDGGKGHVGYDAFPQLKKTTIKKVERAKVSFDSVIAPEEDKQAILSAIEQEKNHDLIFDTWGFGEVFEKGTAISMLFYGIPGTGKTLMAQAIADKLDKKLKVVSTAEIESSEPGGAERAIKQFFEQTKEDTILLFDECDSLVYDRSNLGSILGAQVNQLLTCLEKYKGVVIFTTNQLGVLDEAFNRRLSLKLEFKMPDFEQRKAIWQRMIPKKAPLADDIDWDLLAEFEVTGGYIKNAVLRAARMAAAEPVKGNTKRKISFRHLAGALKAEILAKEEFEAARVNKPRLVGGGYSMSRGIKRDIVKEIGT